MKRGVLGNVREVVEAVKPGLCKGQVILVVKNEHSRGEHTVGTGGFSLLSNPSSHHFPCLYVCVCPL